MATTTKQNWSTQVYHNMVWAKLRVVQYEQNAIKEIEKELERLKDNIPWALEHQPDIRNIEAMAVNLRNRDLTLLMNDFVNGARSATSVGVSDAAYFYESAMYEAFKKDMPWLYEIIPYNRIPEMEMAELINPERMRFLGTTMDAWGEAMKGRTLDAMVNQFRMGMAAGEGMDQIANRLMASTDIAKHSARAMTRTAIQAAANSVSDKVYKANAHMLKGVRYTATLDTRSCETCGGYDGNTYTDLESKPYVPAHISCRCTYVPILKSAAELGLGPLQVPEGVRETMDGLEPETLDYKGWFLKQGEERQKTILGPDKWGKWKAGDWKPTFLEQELIHACSCRSSSALKILTGVA